MPTHGVAPALDGPACIASEAFGDGSGVIHLNAGFLEPGTTRQQGIREVRMQQLLPAMKSAGLVEQRNLREIIERRVITGVTPEQSAGTGGFTRAQRRRRRNPDRL